MALLSAGCRAEEGPPAIPPSDALYEAAPSREIVTDFDPSIFARPDAADGGGREASASGGGEVKRDAAAGPDRTIFRPGVEAGAVGGTCSLLKQDCPHGTACYPGLDGQGVCRMPGGIGPSGPCTDHESCAAGLLCVDTLGGVRLCQPICDPKSQMSCGRGAPCQAFPASSVGVCLP